MNTLIIDTSSNKEIKVGLRIGQIKYFVKKKVERNKAQALLPLIDKILYKKKLKITDVNSIKINARHGSFTGQRVAVSVANALSFALKIPTEDLTKNNK